MQSWGRGRESVSTGRRDATGAAGRPGGFRLSPAWGAFVGLSPLRRSGLFVAVWPGWLDWRSSISKKAFVNSIFNGVTLAGLYFLVASGFTLVFGLMRNVNLAHGSLYLFGAYIGYRGRATGPASGCIGVAAGFMALALIGDTDAGLRVSPH